MADELAVLYEDPALLVLDKPSGLLAVPGLGEPPGHNLAARVQARWSDALVVHRLDQPTSGLMLFARGAAAQRALSIAFAERRIHKHYVAIVAGQVAPESGCIDAPLAVDWPNRPRQHVDRIQGKPSLTRWSVLTRDPPTHRTRLELQPVTGRSHQLRVHLLSIGHPIIGDALYAPEYPAPRLLLHATGLAFDHPLTGAPIRVASPAPF